MDIGKRIPKPSLKKRQLEEEENERREKLEIQKTKKNLEAAHSLIELSKPEIPVEIEEPVIKPLTCNTGAKEYAKFALGNRFDEVMSKLKIARKLYEFTTPGQQCKVTLENEPKKDCWLCGKPLFPEETGATNPKRTVCEHIFPIALAVFFLELHRPKVPSVVSEDAIKKEYEWAHVFCNSIKNKTSFIIEDVTSEGKLNGWKVNKDAIDSMLFKISQKSLKEIGYDLDDDWIVNQSEKIQIRIQSILDTEINTIPDAPMLKYLIGLLKCGDPERLHRFGQLAVEGKPLTKKQRIEGGKRTRRNKRR